MALLTRLFIIGVLAGSLSRLDAGGLEDLRELSFRIRHVIGTPDLLPYDADIEARLLDLNGDGVVDYFFRVVGFSWLIQPAGRNRQAAILEPPPDIGSFVAPFSQGELIHNDLPEGIEWVDRDTPNHSPEFPGSSGINSCTNIGCIGLFQVVAYWGVHFEGEDGRMRYGWVRINANGAPGGLILDWAYESRPGLPIRAGALPGEGLLALEPPCISNGELWLTVSGQLGKRVVIERSMDFNTWTPVRTATSPFQTVLFLEREPPRGFFRVVESE